MRPEGGQLPATPGRNRRRITAAASLAGEKYTNEARMAEPVVDAYHFRHPISPATACIDLAIHTPAQSVWDKPVPADLPSGLPLAPLMSAPREESSDRRPDRGTEDRRQERGVRGAQ